MMADNGNESNLQPEYSKRRGERGGVRGFLNKVKDCKTGRFPNSGRLYAYKTIKVFFLNSNKCFDNGDWTIGETWLKPCLHLFYSLRNLYKKELSEKSSMGVNEIDRPNYLQCTKGAT